MVERVAEAGEIRRADPVLLGAVQHLDLLALGGQTIRYLAGAIGRAVVDDEDLVGAVIRAREHRARGSRDRLNVLGLVVGRQYQPGHVGRQASYPKAC